MVVTVTMNPAIDKTVEVDELQPGDLNRIQKVEYDVGGKGINVSQTIRELGGTSIAVGFLGGNAGRTIEAVLNDCGIQNDFIWVEGETRTNTKVFEKYGAVTELNEPGPTILPAQVEQLIQKLESYANEQTLIVLAGSIPSGVDSKVYASIIQRVHARGAKVLLDTDGELLTNGILAVPDMIKPNRDELEAFAGYDYRASMDELIKTARDLKAKGIETVVVSMGRGGAIMIREGYEASCPALAVKAHSTVGAGDAMVGALAYAWDHQMDDEQTMRLCMAASAGEVTTIGTKPPTREIVDELLPQVVIEPL